MNDESTMEELSNKASLAFYARNRKKGKMGPHDKSQTISDIFAKHLPGKHDQQSHAGELRGAVQSVAGKMDKEVWGGAADYDDAVTFSDVQAAVAKRFPTIVPEDLREALHESIDWNSQALFPNGRVHYEFRDGPTEDMEYQITPENWVSSGDINWDLVIRNVEGFLES